MYSLLSALLLWANPGNTQELRIGDRCPDLVINHVLNYKTSSVRLSDYAGKMILFDFGTSTCAPCLKLLPHLDSLQAEYGDRIQIFMVSFEHEDVFRKAIQRNPRLQAIKHIPFIAADSVLSKQFKHEFYPHEAWLDPNGILIAQTGPDQVTRTNIEKVLAGQKVEFLVKHEEAYDYEQPLITLNAKNIPTAVNTPNEKTLYYSTLSSYIDGIPTRVTYVKDTVNKVQRTSFMNYPLIRMYIQTWGYAWMEWSLNRVKVISKDPSRFYSENSKNQIAWDMNNTYCYESSFPMDLSEKERIKKLHENLDAYLNIHSSIDTMELECWVIKLGTNFSEYRLKTFSRDTALERSRLSGNPYFASPGSLAYTMNYEGHYPPTFDDTGLSKVKGDHYMDQLLDKADFESIRSRLRYFGLDMIKEKRSLPVLVLRDNN